MTEESASETLPPSIERVLKHFRAMGREEKMQALVSYARKLEPLPPRYAAIDRANFAIPECQTRVDIFPEAHDGKLHFYADVNTRESPTIAAFLSILFSAVNDQPPSVALALPADMARRMMNDIGLGSREPGLNAMVRRVKREAIKEEESRKQGAERRPETGNGKQDLPR
jgi:cysteine desulfuration protein SufE